MIRKKQFLSIALCLCMICAMQPAPARADAASSNSWISGTTVKARMTGTTSFNIRGLDGSKDYQTTFMNAGYRTAASVDGGALRDNVGSLLAAGLKLDMNLKKESDSFIRVTYTLSNTGAKSHTVKLGSHADVMIERNDRAPIWATENGGNRLAMSGSPKNDYAFKLIADSCSTIWYGFYSKRVKNCFTDMTKRGPNNIYKKDSGLAYSWNISIAPGDTWTSYVLIGTGNLEQMNVEVPKIPQPEPVIPNPSIALSTSDVYFTEEDTLPSDWNSYITSSEGDVTITGAPADSKTPGDYPVVYKASNSKGTDSKTLTVHILPKPAELSLTTAALKSNTETFTLSATMMRTGGLTWTETGFVYGALQNPTLTLNDGSVKTTTAVSAKNGKLTASVTNLTAGITYYARAYAKASDGTVIYGPQSAGFGLGVPSYGIFSVTNNSNNTFTITRTGGTDDEQTVYYRTVNGSAIGNTHFTHAAGSVTFAKGESKKTVTVTEKNVTTPFKTTEPATSYSNANRTYQLEIYRVDGGATINTSKNKATRTMTADSSYKINRTTYSSEKSKVNITKTSSGKNGERIADTTTKQGGTTSKIHFLLNRFGNENYHTSSSLSTYYSGKLLDYLKSTCSRWLYRYEMYAYEDEDGYEHAYIGSKAVANQHYDLNGANKAVSGIDGQLWACNFLQPQKETHNLYSFPSTESGGGEGSRKPLDFNGTTASLGGKCYVTPALDDPCYLYFSATGKNEDRWWINGLTSYALPHDTVGPQLIGLAPTATGTYLPGDEITIAMVFDEIVDKTNSTAAGLSASTISYVTFSSTSSSNISNVIFKYAGGADTNVLYFTGTVPEKAGGPYELQVTIKGIEDKVRDMSDNKARGDFFYTTDASVSKAAKPTVAVNSLTNSTGTLTGKIVATNADKLEYAWTNSAAVPAHGWKMLSNKTNPTVTTRQTSGTWYLHARATNSDGQTATAYKNVTIPSTGTDTYAAPELTVSVNNTAWAKTRPITVTRSPSTAIVNVKTPDGTESTVSGSSYTADTEGLYTFTLTSGSGSNTETVTRQAVVSKLDNAAPAITIHDLPGTSYTERVSLNFSVADSGSGVKSVTAKWNSTTITPVKNADGTYTVTCPDTSGNVSGKFTVTAADNLSNSATQSSKTYTINLKAPTLTVRNTSSGEKGDTYSYTVNANSNTGIVIHLPDGTETTALSGSFTLAEAGDYAITVTDDAGHFVSKDLTVIGKVDGVAPEVRLYPDEISQSGNLNVDIEVYEEGSTPTVKRGNTTLTMASEGDGVYSSSFTVTEGGTYTVTATDEAGNSGNDSIIVYALVDGSSKTLKLAVDGTYGTLPEPSAKEGYTFDGWYTKERGGTKVTGGSPETNGYTLYAQWTAIISVDISWSDLDFSYSDGTWNSENHSYENGGWTTSTPGGNKITVGNKGVTDVNITFSYTQINHAVSGSFTNEAGEAVTSPMTLPAKNEKYAWLNLSGKPDQNLDKAAIGTVTITLGGN